jgi:integrase/recombinase XerD
MRKARRPKAPRHCYWENGVLYGRQTIAGQKRRWSLHTDDVEIAAQRVKADRERALTAATYGDARVSWEDAVIGWAESYIPDRGIGANAAKRYAVSLRQMEPWLLRRFVDEIDAGTVAEIINGRRRADIATATLRRDLGALASVLTYCQSERHRTDNPAFDRLRLIKEKRDPVVLPVHAHIHRVIERAPGLMADLIRAAWATGCRLNELAYAQRQNLDHDRHELTVIGKGNKLRVIGLDYQGGYELLRALPTWAGGKWLFWHGQGEPYRNLSSRFALIVRSVFTAAYDETHGTTARTRPPLEQLLAAQDDRDWKDIGFRTFRFHDLRHLHAVEWLRSGRSIYDLQGRLGHNSITTTEMVYLTFLTEEQKRAVKHPGEQAGRQQVRRA